MKIAPRDIDQFIKAPPADLLIALFYGQDDGLISERAKALSTILVPDLNDPFAVTDITGEQIGSEPSLLYDSAAAIPAMGQKRLVRVFQASDTIAASVSQVLENPPSQAVIVISGRDINTKSKLVKMLDNAKQTATIGCYPDQQRQIAHMARDMFAEYHIKADTDAMAWITSHLGGDRLMSRSEIEKLTIMAGPNGHITLDMVMNALGDSASVAASQVVSAAASGDILGMGQQFDRAITEGIAPEAIIRASITYFQRLFRLCCQMDRGMNAADAVNQYKPPIFFNEKPVISSQLNHWSSHHVMIALDRLGQAEKQSRTGIHANTAVSQALLAVCQIAQRRRR
ncbi:MAG: DNA polymerase III subunit delta [Candidatus Puniceispirillales bacterium]